MSEEKPTYEELEGSLKWYQDTFSDYRKLCKQWHDLVMEQDIEIRGLATRIEELEDQLAIEETDPDDYNMAEYWGDWD